MRPLNQNQSLKYALRAISLPFLVLVSSLSYASSCPEFLQSKLQQAFADGPDVWIHVGEAPEGTYLFQRGLSGGGPIGHGHDEAIAIIEGVGLETERAVSRFGEHPGQEVIPSVDALESTAHFYAKPMAIRAYSAQSIRDPHYSKHHPGEGQLPRRSRISDQVTDLGLFFPNSGDARVYYQWAYEYLELYRYLHEQGVEISLESRGGSFLNELNEAFQKVEQKCREAFQKLSESKNINDRPQLNRAWMLCVQQNTASFAELVAVFERWK